MDSEWASNGRSSKPVPANLPTIEECTQQRLAESPVYKAHLPLQRYYRLSLPLHICQRETLGLKGGMRPGGVPLMEEGGAGGQYKENRIRAHAGLQTGVLCARRPSLSPI